MTDEYAERESILITRGDKQYFMNICPECNNMNYIDNESGLCDECTERKDDLEGLDIATRTGELVTAVNAELKTSRLTNRKFYIGDDKAVFPGCQELRNCCATMIKKLHDLERYNRMLNLE